MSSTRQYQDGKVAITILVIINVALLAAVFWLLNRPSLDDLKPVTGEIAYLMAVNQDGDPVIYSKDGVRWPFCQKGECKDIPSDIDVNFPYENGFILMQLNGTPLENRGQRATGISDLLIPVAIAQEGDGVCPVKGYKVYNKQLVRQYPTTEEDSDCPPH